MKIALLICFIIAVWLYYPLWVKIFSDFTIPVNSNLQEFGGSFGTFGDSFGALNTLFSGLAFAGIIISIFLQSQELKDTREEVKKQREEFQSQTNALNKQVFENTFFQLLNSHIKIIDSISHSNGWNFKQLYVDQFVNKHFMPSPNHNFNNKIDQYMKFYEAYNHILSRYFITIYQILKFVDESPIENKKFYTNLLRAQLSSDELALLFFNCLSDLGNEKFKPLIEKYEFFEHLPKLEFIESEDIKMYEIKAYGKTNAALLNIHKAT